MKAVILLSGGLDSATVLAIARHEQRDCIALSFAYGQRHDVELAAAVRVAASLSASAHVIYPLDLRIFGASALTADIDVPKDSVGTPGIPITYVPARNTVFLAISLALAEARGAQEIWIGVNAIDYSGYPDCRPEFIAAFQDVIMKGTRSGVEKREPRLVAPLIQMTKAQIIRRGADLGVDFSLTHSCYDPDSQGRACGRCDACLLRKHGFAEAKLADPTVYANDER
jgi:7-cyano-7-deazaguanine synthase